ncbi:bifunctional lysylphosphatidylglycerol flippase/synthetase MprF [Labrys monachus]|uniref:Phosphatidylglycerol lysyltransferase n=1 Tax=Labrys monachus TaxID=217067 RepID=A0ABU0F9M9_9HYPH|nr:bifunctional lysylphosphatidylglycerol flippase/synthetase MprF [Labrys monachus]MDQ0390765.1 phosphatidylglycerol lysyltransferase [Labrys monachus]
MVGVVGSLDRAVSRDEHAGAIVPPADGAAAGGEGGAPAPGSWFGRVDWSKAGLVVGLMLFVVASLVLYDMLEDLTWAEVSDALSRIAWHQVILAFGATALSYTALIGYDLLALRHVGARQVPLAAVAFTSFVSQAFTFTLGFGVLTGGAVRWRIYQGYGLKPGQILGVGALTTLTFWLGIASVAAACLLFQPSALAPIDDLPPSLNLLVGIAVLAGVAAWMVIAAIRPRVATFGDWTMPLPGPQATLGAILVGLLDTCAAAAALWLILPAGPDAGFLSFLIVFAVATVLGVISHVPGGVGIFEATLLLAQPQIPRADMVGSLLLFRLVYYAVPFAIACLMLGLYEARQRRQAVGRAAQAVQSIARPLAPRVAGIAVFIGGVILLISGATPAEQYRLVILHRLVPLPFVETSHFAASVTGFVLLIVAYGLIRRMANAWRMAVLLLTAAAVFSLLKGLDFEEAIVCSVVAAFLVFYKDEFYRQADLFSVRPSFEWVVACIVAVGASIWLGFFVSRNIEYQNMLWWDFAYREDVPRFMRATLGIVVAAVGIAAYIMMNRSRVAFDPATPEEMQALIPLIESSTRSDAHLALLGDKRFLLSAGGKGFTMYAVQGRSWVAMGDPVAPEEEIDGLVWRFKELVDRHGGTAVFYQVTTGHLPTYLDAGFSLAKLGEEAWVDLAKFTLEGSEGRRLRQAKAKAERSGATFDIVPAAGVPAILGELEAVSDAWLNEKGKKEKGFSLGFWSPDYVRRYDQAVIRQNGHIVAFANIWRGSDKKEYTVDLMRYLPDGPAGMMDLLFIGLLAQAKSEGYRWFNLGMAPLSGLPHHRLASMWSRIGAFVYRRGDRFYNFEGLRAYKDKFKPEWRPKYLAFPGGLALPQILMDVTGLIASSPRRALSEENS